METRFLALVRGKGCLLSLDQLLTISHIHHNNGLVIVYHHVLDGERLRQMTEKEKTFLPLRDNSYLLELRTDHDHPEQLSGEMFLGNWSTGEIALVFCQTGFAYRCGKNAFGKHGTYIKGHVPVFAKLSDIFTMVKWP